jgi:ferritin-like metal-binding protein YciE
MNTTAELIDWLRDAYAMEKAMETALKKLTEHPDTHSALRQQAAKHGVETRQHAEALAACLRHLGSDTSSLKTVLAQGLDLMRGAGSTFARDERIKDVLTVLVPEHFEIACLTILRTRAVQLGLHNIVHICDEILLEEKRMTQWLQIHLPQIIAAYIAPVSVTGTLFEASDDRDQSEDSNDERVAQWEFIQLAQTASSFFGGQTHGGTLVLN